MEKRHVCSFLIGLSAGSAIGLLFAPHSGKKNRAQIREAASDGAAYIKGCGETAHDLVQEGKNEMMRQQDGIIDGVRRGVDAYQKAVS